MIVYDCKFCDIGIVYIGYGVFYWVYQVVYLDDYMQVMGDLCWGIVVVNLCVLELLLFVEVVQVECGYFLKFIVVDGIQEFWLIWLYMEFVDVVMDLNVVFDFLFCFLVYVVFMMVMESGYYFKDDWSFDFVVVFVVDEFNGGGFVMIYGFLM